MDLKPHMILASLLSLTNISIVSAASGPEHERPLPLSAIDPSTSVSFAQSYSPSAPPKPIQCGSLDPRNFRIENSPASSSSSSSSLYPTSYANNSAPFQTSSSSSIASAYQLPERRFDFEQAWVAASPSVSLSGLQQQAYMPFLTRRKQGKSLPLWDMHQGQHLFQQVLQLFSAMIHYKR